MKKYKVIVEQFDKRDDSYRGEMSSWEFDNEADARKHYESLDIAGWYKSFLSRQEKKKMYLEKGLYTFEVEKDDDGEEHEVDDSMQYEESEAAGKQSYDSYDVYEIEKEGERIFISVEIEDGVITLREHAPAGDEDFADVESWETDRDWDSRYLTDNEYEHLFDGVKVLNEK